MPTRKQRRRREKNFRHEYELVEIDPETGEERTVDAAALRAEKEKERPKRERPAAQQPRQRTARAGREPQPPSWRRVGKRTLIFAPLMALFIYWTQSSSKNGVNAAAVVLNTAILIAFFAPFSYLVDSMAYKFYAKRTGKLPANGEASKRRG